MTQQEHNAALLLHAWNLGKAIVPYTGSTIFDLLKIVEHRQPLPPKPTASEIDRFLSDGRPDEFDHDREAEDQRD